MGLVSERRPANDKGVGLSSAARAACRGTGTDCAVVVAELHLVQLGRQVLDRELVVAADDKALEERPDALDGVRVDVAADPLRNRYDVRCFWERPHSGCRLSAVKHGGYLGQYTLIAERLAGGSPAFSLAAAVGYPIGERRRATADSQQPSNVESPLGGRLLEYWSGV